MSITLTLDPSVVEFLNSFFNKSAAVDDILLQSEAYQYWREACAEILIDRNQ